MKQTDLLKPTSNKIKNETNTADNILKTKKFMTLFPKNFPSKQETTRFKKGKNKASKYIRLIF